MLTFCDFKPSVRLSNSIIFRLLPNPNRRQKTNPKINQKIIFKTFEASLTTKIYWFSPNFDVQKWLKKKRG